MMRLTLRQIIRVLDSREEVPEPPYWFWSGELEGYSEGDSFCEDCIKAIMPDAKYGDNYTGGSAYESDGCATCDKCHKLLQYTLTNYGVQSEMSHFEENRLDYSDLKNPQTCYELARIAHGLYSAEDKKAFRLLFEKQWLRKAVRGQR